LEATERVIVALDTNLEQARALAEQLQGRARWLKVGMTLFYSAGPGIVQEFKDRGYQVFVDLKLHDIPHQVRGAAKAVAAAGADMLTVHAAGGLAMMQAACQGAEEGAVKTAAGGTREGATGGIREGATGGTREGAAGGKREGAAVLQPAGKRPICLAITVLTSLDAAELNSTGINDAPASQALRMAGLAKEAGMDGIVCSPQETASIRSTMGEDFVLVTPGVRPVGSNQQDQARIATPSQAVAAGADYLVIGRPITEAADPLAAFERIVKEMQDE